MRTTTCPRCKKFIHELDYMECKWFGDGCKHWREYEARRVSSGEAAGSTASGGDGEMCCAQCGLTAERWERRGTVWTVEPCGCVVPTFRRSTPVYERAQ